MKEGAAASIAKSSDDKRRSPTSHSTYISGTITMGFADISSGQWSPSWEQVLVFGDQCGGERGQ